MTTLRRRLAGAAALVLLAGMAGGSAVSATAEPPLGGASGQPVKLVRQVLTLNQAKVEAYLATHGSVPSPQWARANFVQADQLGPVMLTGPGEQYCIVSPDTGYVGHTLWDLVGDEMDAPVRVRPGESVPGFCGDVVERNTLYDLPVDADWGGDLDALGEYHFEVMDSSSPPSEMDLVVERGQRVPRGYGKIRAFDTVQLVTLPGEPGSFCAVGLTSTFPSGTGVWVSLDDTGGGWGGHEGRITPPPAGPCAELVEQGRMTTFTPDPEAVAHPPYVLRSGQLKGTRADFRRLDKQAEQYARTLATKFRGQRSGGRFPSYAAVSKSLLYPQRYSVSYRTFQNRRSFCVNVSVDHNRNPGRIHYLGSGTRKVTTLNWSRPREARKIVRSARGGCADYLRKKASRPQP